MRAPASELFNLTSATLIRRAGDGLHLMGVSHHQGSHKTEERAEKWEWVSERRVVPRVSRARAATPLAPRAALLPASQTRERGQEGGRESVGG